LEETIARVWQERGSVCTLSGAGANYFAERDREAKARQLARLGDGVTLQPEPVAAQEPAAHGSPVPLDPPDPVPTLSSQKEGLKRLID